MHYWSPVALHRRFDLPVNSSQILILIVTERKSRLQIQHSQCLVDCQCHRNLLRCLCANLIALQMWQHGSILLHIDFVEINLTPISNVVNALFPANNVASFSAPWVPISFPCFKMFIEVLSGFVSMPNLTAKSKVVNTLLVIKASAIISAPFAPILLLFSLIGINKLEKLLLNYENHP